MSTWGKADLKGARLNERSDGADAGAGGKYQELLDGLVGSLVNGEAVAHHMADVHLATCMTRIVDNAVRTLAKRMPKCSNPSLHAHAAWLML